MESVVLTIDLERGDGMHGNGHQLRTRSRPDVDRSVVNRVVQREHVRHPVQRLDGQTAEGAGFDQSPALGGRKMLDLAVVRPLGDAGHALVIVGRRLGGAKGGVGRSVHGVYLLWSFHCTTCGGVPVGPKVPWPSAGRRVRIAVPGCHAMAGRGEFPRAKRASSSPIARENSAPGTLSASKWTPQHSRPS